MDVIIRVFQCVLSPLLAGLVMHLNRHRLTKIEDLYQENKATDYI